MVDEETELSVDPWPKEPICGWAWKRGYCRLPTAPLPSCIEAGSNKISRSLTGKCHGSALTGTAGAMGGCMIPSRQARTEKVILQMTRSLIKPITQWIYSTNTFWMKHMSLYTTTLLHIQSVLKEHYQLGTCLKMSQSQRKTEVLKLINVTEMASQCMDLTGKF